LVARFSESPRWITLERGDDGGDAVVTLVNFDDSVTSIPFGPKEGTWELAVGTHEVGYGGPTAGAEPPSRLEVVGETSVWVACPAGAALIYVKSRTP
jgi:hypothetical protein